MTCLLISGSDVSMFFIKNTGDYLEWTEQIITERHTVKAHFPCDMRLSALEQSFPHIPQWHRFLSLTALPLPRSSFLLRSALLLRSFAGLENREDFVCGSVRER